MIKVAVPKAIPAVVIQKLCIRCTPKHQFYKTSSATNAPGLIMAVALFA